MAHRVIFWRPRPGIDIWQPAERPLGETIRSHVLGGGRSELLDSFPAAEMLQRLKTVFSQARTDEKGYLHWSDDLGNGFVARCGDQFVEVCSFDLTDEDLDKVFSIAEEYRCEHYDWGN